MKKVKIAKNRTVRMRTKTNLIFKKMKAQTKTQLFHPAHIEPTVAKHCLQFQNEKKV